jgi:hypothetical protein
LEYATDGYRLVSEKLSEKIILAKFKDLAFTHIQ